jgi:hypothetical protein
MTNNLLSQFQQQEAENTAMQVKFNRWSLVMIELMIQEQEQKLLASDLPVDGDEPSGPVADDNFWEEIA